MCKYHQSNSISDIPGHGMMKPVSGKIRAEHPDPNGGWLGDELLVCPFAFALVSL